SGRGAARQGRHPTRPYGRGDRVARVCVARVEAREIECNRPRQGIANGGGGGRGDVAGGQRADRMRESRGGGQGERAGVWCVFAFCGWGGDGDCARGDRGGAAWGEHAGCGGDRGGGQVGDRDGDDGRAALSALRRGPSRDGAVVNGSPTDGTDYPVVSTARV